MSDDKNTIQINISGERARVTNITGDHHTFGDITMGDRPEPEKPSAPTPPKLKAHLFISYRRSASEDFAHLLRDKLLPHIDGEVFLDVKSLGAGKYAPELEARVRNCTILLLLIAPGTFNRIHEPDDWVRREIETALDNGRVILPVYKGDMPRLLERDLPPSIRQLVTFNDVRIHGDNVDGGVMNLLAKLRQSFS